MSRDDDGLERYIAFGPAWEVVESERCANGAIVARAFVDVDDAIEIEVLVLEDGTLDAGPGVCIRPDVAAEIAAGVLEHLAKTGYSLAELALDDADT